MTSLFILLGILSPLLLGAMSPGPSFVLVSRLAVTGSRLSGIGAALGMGAGGAIFASLALFGLIALLQQVEWLFLTLKIVGGVYLVYLGIRIWRSATEPLELTGNGSGSASRSSVSMTKSFWLGLTTQIANPKTAIVYASIFAALLPADPDTALLILLPPAIFLVEAGWYTIVAVIFSAPVPQRAYIRSKGIFDRIAGAVLGGLGIRLIFEKT